MYYSGSYGGSLSLFDELLAKASRRLRDGPRSNRKKFSYITQKIKHHTVAPSEGVPILYQELDELMKAPRSNCGGALDVIRQKFTDPAYGSG